MQLADMLSRSGLEPELKGLGFTTPVSRVMRSDMCRRTCHPDLSGDWVGPLCVSARIDLLPCSCTASGAVHSGPIKSKPGSRHTKGSESHQNAEGT